MNKWSKNYDKCQNCGTERFKHKARGYCTRCYGPVMALEQVDRWNPSDPQSLKGPFYSFYYDLVKDDPGMLERIRTETKSEIKKRLDLLKRQEEKRTGPIDGIDIEHQLQHIVSLCGARNEKLFFGRATSIDHNFNPEQREILYKLLSKIEEAVPQRGISIDWQKVLSGRR